MLDDNGSISKVCWLVLFSRSEALNSTGRNNGADWLWAYKNAQCEGWNDRNGLYILAGISCFWNFPFSVCSASDNHKYREAAQREIQYRPVHLPAQNVQFLWGRLELIILNFSELWHQAPESSLKAYEDSYQCSASIYTLGKVKQFPLKTANSKYYVFQPLRFLASTSRVFTDKVWN